ncbi:hypothetical protein PM10SUCC1_28940 [Propionigenium maris DSM 9537]|uniref:Peptidase M26 N-terminal domain-containing protein n=1 Tax=Propionigenium maris DSM 9537 TaxID=1123000 RepID=A0A9W6LPU6_9FUSO|nr:ZmpA/ZmpB/ZmpC family metallo-endopeptidase-related protein [Propionigenium maris]GLI57380.1 hypothetical protein PM10SUCC1_28940 [Propionigenium maris DSM 9537]
MRVSVTGDKKIAYLKGALLSRRIVNKRKEELLKESNAYDLYHIAEADRYVRRLGISESSESKSEAKSSTEYEYNKRYQLAKKTNFLSEYDGNDLKRIKVEQSMNYLWENDGIAASKNKLSQIEREAVKEFDSTGKDLRKSVKRYRYDDNKNLKWVEEPRFHEEDNKWYRTWEAVGRNKEGLVTASKSSVLTDGTGHSLETGSFVIYSAGKNYPIAEFSNLPILRGCQAHVSYIGFADYEESKNLSSLKDMGWILSVNDFKVLSSGGGKSRNNVLLAMKETEIRVGKDTVSVDSFVGGFVNPGRGEIRVEVDGEAVLKVSGERWQYIEVPVQSGKGLCLSLPEGAIVDMLWCKPEGTAIEINTYTNDQKQQTYKINNNVGTRFYYNNATGLLRTTYQEDLHSGETMEASIALGGYGRFGNKMYIAKGEEIKAPTNENYLFSLQSLGEKILNLDSLNEMPPIDGGVFWEGECEEEHFHNEISVEISSNNLGKIGKITYQPTSKEESGAQRGKYIFEQPGETDKIIVEDALFYKQWNVVLSSGTLLFFAGGKLLLAEVFSKEVVGPYSLSANKSFNNNIIFDSPNIMVDISNGAGDTIQKQGIVSIDGKPHLRAEQIIYNGSGDVILKSKRISLTHQDVKFLEYIPDLVELDWNNELRIGGRVEEYYMDMKLSTAPAAYLKLERDGVGRVTKETKDITDLGLVAGEGERQTLVSTSYNSTSDSLGRDYNKEYYKSKKREMKYDIKRNSETNFKMVTEDIGTDLQGREFYRSLKGPTEEVTKKIAHERGKGAERITHEIVEGCEESREISTTVLPDVYDRVIMRSEPDIVGGVITVRDSLGRKRFVNDVLDGEGNRSPHWRYFLYDRIGRLKEEGTVSGLEALDSIEKLVEAADNIEFPEDGKNTTISYFYGIEGMLETNSDMEQLKNLDGNLTKVVTFTGVKEVTTHYSYDGFGRITGIGTKLNDEKMEVVSYEYNGINKPTKVSHPKAEILYKYDTLGRMESVTVNGVVVASDYIYDLYDRVVEKRMSEIIERRRYNLNDSLEHVRYFTKEDSADNLLYSESLDYDGDEYNQGYITGIEERTNSKRTTKKYAYDYRGRLISSESKDEDSGITDSITYSYDLYGNMLEKKKNEESTSYLHENSNNQLTVYWSDDREPNYISYNDMGDTVSKTFYSSEAGAWKKKTYRYEEGTRRLKEVVLEDEKPETIHGSMSCKVTYVYDHLGRRVSKTHKDVPRNPDDITGSRIYSARQFCNMNPYGNYELVCDIDMNEITSDPSAGNYPKTDVIFKGTLDGGGYTVKNLRLDGTSLFAEMKGGAKVRNLKFENVKFLDKSDSYLIASKMYAGTLIDNVLVDGLSSGHGSTSATFIRRTISESGVEPPTIKNCEIRNAEFGCNLYAIAHSFRGKLLNCVIEGITGSHYRYMPFLFSIIYDEADIENCVVALGNRIGEDIRIISIGTNPTIRNCYIDQERYASSYSVFPFLKESTRTLQDPQFYRSINWDQNLWDMKDGEYPTLRTFKGECPQKPL